MLIFVISFNLLLVATNLYLAWRIWKLRLTLVKITETLNNVEKIIYNVFHQAPPPILGVQRGTRNLKQSYIRLELQLQKLRKILTLLNLLTNFWGWSKSASFKSNTKDKFSRE